MGIINSNFKIKSNEKVFILFDSSNGIFRL